MEYSVSNLVPPVYPSEDLINKKGGHANNHYSQGIKVLEDLLSMEGHEEMNEHFNYPPNWKTMIDRYKK